MRLKPLVKPAAFIERAASQITDSRGGDVPRDHADLVVLRGVGDYTARSVLTRVDGAGIAAVDVNARRLLSRVFGIDADADALERLADALAPTARRSDFRHATLDFAADVRTVLSPQCESCPIEELSERNLNFRNRYRTLL